jgi:hypothetical protein
MAMNRRRSVRIPWRCSAEWHRGKRHIATEVVNINAHGMLLRTEELIPLNQLMDVLVHLPTGDVSVMVVSRFVGPTRWGHAIGVEIHVASAIDQTRWTSFYRTTAARRSISPV